MMAAESWHTKFTRDGKKELIGLNLFRLYRIEVMKTPGLGLAERIDEAERDWGEMTEKERAPFEKLAREENKRRGYKVKPKRSPKKKVPRDPGAPKKSLNAFLMFCRVYGPPIQKKNPTYKGKSFVKLMGTKWAGADRHTKARCQKLAEEDKLRYQKEMKAYERNKAVSGQGSSKASGEQEQESSSDEEVFSDEMNSDSD